MKALFIFRGDWQVSMMLLIPSIDWTCAKRQALLVWPGLVHTRPSAVALSISRLCPNPCSCPVTVWELIIPFSGRGRSSLCKVTWHASRERGIQQQSHKCFRNRTTPLLLEIQVIGKARQAFLPSATHPGTSLEATWGCSVRINFSNCAVVCCGKLELCFWTKSIADVFRSNKGKEPLSCGVLLIVPAQPPCWVGTIKGLGHTGSVPLKKPTSGPFLAK